jgi:hypothetical protein
VHVTLALLVPKSLLAMLTGGPVVGGGQTAGTAVPEIKATPLNQNE